MPMIAPRAGQMTVGIRMTSDSLAAWSPRDVPARADQVGTLSIFAALNAQRKQNAHEQQYALNFALEKVD